MTQHDDLTQRQLFNLIKSKMIALAGNQKLKIYGRLNCASGQRMKRKNRVFFLNATEAIAGGFRPCGHCMREHYDAWKKAITF